jgi:hypothetical protein
MLGRILAVSIVAWMCFWIGAISFGADRNDKSLSPHASQEVAKKKEFGIADRFVKRPRGRQVVCASDIFDDDVLAIIARYSDSFARDVGDARNFVCFGSCSDGSSESPETFEGMSSATLAKPVKAEVVFAIFRDPNKQSTKTLHLYKGLGMIRIENASFNGIVVVPFCFEVQIGSDQEMHVPVLRTSLKDVWCVVADTKGGKIEGTTPTSLRNMPGIPGAQYQESEKGAEKAPVKAGKE